jgi:hypothetical protein
MIYGQPVWNVTDGKNEELGEKPVQCQFRETFNSSTIFHNNAYQVLSSSV